MMLGHGSTLPRHAMECRYLKHDDFTDMAYVKMRTCQAGEERQKKMFCQS